MPGRGQGGGGGADEHEQPKPLAASLIQELQNLKDKFKSEDDGVDRGERQIGLHQRPVSNYLYNL